MIINIDELIPEDKTIIFHNEELKISNEVPVKMILNLMKCNADMQENPVDEKINLNLINVLSDIIKFKNPDFDKQKFADSVTLREIGELSKIIFDIKDDIKKNI